MQILSSQRNAGGAFSCEQRTEYDPLEKLTIGKCPRCGYVMLASETDYGRVWEPVERLFPSADKTLGRSIPMPIRGAYQEAVQCFKVKAYTASAIMCRKTLEGLCQAHGVKAC
jgi:ssDNA-binding Zn-finger/Zn-ribbon topoisomerase 1